jgi:prepilin-type processing-associated H-X9-DG protein
MPGHWTEGSLVGGKCSYGYNVHLGKNRKTPAADTIVLMDYDHWIINRAVTSDDGELDPARNDPPHYITPRHGGRANCMMGDGHVQSREPQEISEDMWTLEPDD